MKKNKLKIIGIAAGGIVLAAIALITALYAGHTSSQPDEAASRLHVRIGEYAEIHGISVEEVQKDKTLMAQLQMELNQEDKIEQLTQEVQVTAEEIENYRNMIGTSMDRKKAVLILFNTSDECKSFISEHGGDQNPQARGIGTIPLMQTDDDGAYYNISGNENLETVFDSLQDGEYTKEPFAYAGMHCYLKRLGIASPVGSDEKLVELIKTEKAHALLQNKE